MKKYVLFIVALTLSCSKDELQETSLASYLANREVVLEGVIACAASNQNDNLVSVFLYPRPGVTSIRYFAAPPGAMDKNNFDGYEPIAAPLLDVFNGFMKKFEVAIEEEKWVIVSFEEDNRVYLSNPIRIKNQTKPTEYLSSNVVIEQNTINPLIVWEDGTYDDTRIYFQVVSDVDENFISGTYTFDRSFTYYDLDNVVLNITPGTPPDLQFSTTYGFTLLAVSADNWVNLFSVKSFTP